MNGKTSLRLNCSTGDSEEFSPASGFRWLRGRISNPWIRHVAVECCTLKESQDCGVLARTIAVCESFALRCWMAHQRGLRPSSGCLKPYRGLTAVRG